MIKLACYILLLCCINCRSKEADTIPSIDMLLADSTTHYNTIQVAKGKPVVLIDFSPTCPHSQNETDSILKDMKVYKDITFCFIADKDPIFLKGYTRIFKLNDYSNIVIGHDYKHTFAALFKNKGYPYLVVYDSDHKIRGVFAGERPRAELRSFIQKL